MRGSSPANEERDWRAKSVKHASEQALDALEDVLGQIRKQERLKSRIGLAGGKHSGRRTC